MQIVPFETLEAHARQAYRTAMRNQPTVKVVNAEAVVELLTPRVLELGGVSYRAPPVPFEVGLRLHIATLAFDDRRQAPEATLRATHDTVARFFASTLEPVSRWRAPWHRRHLRRFLLATLPSEMLLLARWVLDLADDHPLPPATGRGVRRHDFLDHLVQCAAACPALMDPSTGLPRTWQAYLAVARYLARQRAREDLRLALAVRHGVNANAKQFTHYAHDEGSLAGWR